ncbi:MAG: 7,8-didemethyl-8-hydroxy-5-deazariboflavin synthase subunit CofG [Candidatus Margulisbacteria bacterium]|jgi:7,8-didemethyl-8-hydroxy-5-deazariboflavin synthase CofG subunit|nr:7,8-didemethyl-8-hydroxy-5-deazariboflavin synthase subunit CofG [Candidatus Margulisiibacteriota bacterium]
MNKNIVTYSRSATINLSRICSALCDYCSYPVNNLDQNQFELVIPYSTIKLCAQAKKAGAKEVMFQAGERPDNFSAVRARLDLWGFSSYIEYVYTVCELVFLEGLLPSINIGYISKEEMQIIRRMSASIYMMIDCADERILQKYSPRKTLQSRVETISYAGAGKVPVTTGILVGLGESDRSRREALEIIKALHGEYGNIQNVEIRPYEPSGGKFEPKEVKKSDLLRVIETARRILPEDVPLTAPGAGNEQARSFINAGVRDLGAYDVAEEKALGRNYGQELSVLEKYLQKKGLGLQRRLPIFSKYIVENWYSRKLAQVLDRYKALLKNSAEVDLENIGDGFAEELALDVPRKNAAPPKRRKAGKTANHPRKKR